MGRRNQPCGGQAGPDATDMRKIPFKVSLANIKNGFSESTYISNFHIPIAVHWRELAGHVGHFSAIFHAIEGTF